MKMEQLTLGGLLFNELADASQCVAMPYVDQGSLQFHMVLEGFSERRNYLSMQFHMYSMNCMSRFIDGHDNLVSSSFSIKLQNVLAIEGKLWTIRMYRTWIPVRRPKLTVKQPYSLRRRVVVLASPGWWKIKCSASARRMAYWWLCRMHGWCWFCLSM